MNPRTRLRGLTRWQDGHQLRPIPKMWRWRPAPSAAPWAGAQVAVASGGELFDYQGAPCADGRHYRHWSGT